MAKNVKFTLFQYIAILFLFFFNIIYAGAQPASNPFLYEESIRLLKKGYLLVRIESFDKKVQHYERVKNQDSCNDKCQEKIQKNINDILKERDNFNIEYIKAFKKLFNFCPVSFYYDKDHTMFVEKEFSILKIVDEQLNTKEINCSSKDSFLILKKDHTPQSENEGWLFQTKDGITLGAGFPYVNSNNAKTLMNYFSSKNHLKKNCEHMVRKLNKELHKYYLKTEQKRLEAQHSIEEE